MKFHLFIILYFLSINWIISQDEIKLDSTVLLKREISSGLNKPWEIKWGPNDHIWVTERPGRVQRLNPETGNITTILDLSDSVSQQSEAGMLGFCFHPEFEQNKLIFINYDQRNSSNNLIKTIATYKLFQDTLILENIILGNIPTWVNHSGCRMLISNDKKLFFTLGDRFVQDSSQDLASPSGKIHRINLDGTIPNDNPFANSSIYSFGHRNPQGLMIHPNGTLFSTEHGASMYDEFNVIKAGQNYGWPHVEGVCNTNAEINYCDKNDVKEPIWQTDKCTALNDLFLYNHVAIPEWKNKVLMAVLGGAVKTPSLSVYTISNNNQVENVEHHFNELGRIRDVCANPYTGSIYLVTNGFRRSETTFNSIIEYYNPDYEITTSQIKYETNQYLDFSPNPVLNSENISIRCSEDFINATIDIFNLNGKKVYSKKIENTNFYILPNNVGSGTFVIRAANNNGTITKKIIIQ
ncbi:MAG: T9SS type A sorting domain-containing protein [Saprospiraceae bacterium]|nr:T9SS type A sorting domain-containing protein [Saprospiraceae bacterium]